MRKILKEIANAILVTGAITYLPGTIRSSHGASNIWHDYPFEMGMMTLAIFPIALSLFRHMGAKVDISTHDGTNEAGHAP